MPGSKKNGGRENPCVVSSVRNGLLQAISQTSGLCGNCRHDLGGLIGLLSAIIEGDSKPADLEKLSRLACDLSSRGHCAPVASIMAPLISSIEHSLPEYEAHAFFRNCPARACPKLIPAPCQNACPAGIDIPGYLSLAARGLYQEALELIREDNPFPWVCGLICPHPCESDCVRANLDQAVNIRYLKAFVAEQALKESRFQSARAPDSAKAGKVAVIGSGPAGLSAAYYLALAGYGTTIFEALPKPGGLLAYGIPEYRLPREVVNREIEIIRSLGVEIRTGTLIGKDVSLDELRAAGYNAFFLAIGAHRGHRLGIEGEAELAPVFDAISFLREINSGTGEKPGDRVVVIGGGNSAMDAARTSIRLGSKEVHVAYRRSRAEMPANPREIEEAMEEGVIFDFLTVPVKIGGGSGSVAWLDCLEAKLGEPDAGGRRRPVPIEGSNFRIAADAVIAAIGQGPDLSPFSDNLPCDTSRRNQLLTQPPGTRTNVADVFAGGDAVTGPATVVRAIAAGKRAALEIDLYLSRKDAREPLFLNRKRPPRDFVPIPAARKTAAQRIPMPLAEVESRRAGFEPVELALSEEQARIEASRCLRCDVCIRCGECEKVCREQMKVEALSFRETGPDERILSDYARPGERCIGCGACALACPTGAMQILDSQGFRELRMCGTVLNSMAVLSCANCGGPFVPERFLEFVKTCSDAVMGKEISRDLCPTCAREISARSLANCFAPGECSGPVIPLAAHTGTSST